MPEEQYWETLFDVPLVVDSLTHGEALGDVAEMGCGFGTFSIPFAQRISGHLYTFDIDPLMVARTQERARAAGLENVVCQQRDVMEAGFGLRGKSVDAVLLFNILHGESPELLLKHAADLVRPGGHVLVIHWRHDPRTPRGPDLAIRPKPEQVASWAHSSGQLQRVDEVIDLPPWHYGLRLLRTD